MEDFASQTTRVQRKHVSFGALLSGFSTRLASLRNRLLKRNSLSKPLVKRLFLLLVGIIVVVSVVTIFFSVRAGMMSKGASDKQSNAGANQVQLEKPLAHETLNKTYLFPLRDASGKLLGNISYVLQDAELRTQIIVNGQQATSIAGREFLIIDLKLTNNYQKEITINARDYVRLMRNGTTEKLAPDIHNDPVNVQAISTEYTRIGFPINTTDKDLKLQVGEIDGTKDIVPLSIQ